MRFPSIKRDAREKLFFSNFLEKGRKGKFFRNPSWRSIGEIVDFATTAKSQSKMLYHTISGCMTDGVTTAKKQFWEHTG
jgi:hypothetical protein